MAPETISPSQITLYLTCSLKYKFDYIDRLPKATRSAALALGTAVHAALQWLHRDRKAGRNPPLDEVLRVFAADWHAQTTATDVLTREDPDTLLLKGKELLTAYYHQPWIPVQGAEVPFQIPLVNPETGEILDLPLRGVIDLIETDGALVEFKTPQRTPPADAIADNLQLTAYAYAYETLFGKPPSTIRLVNLVKTKQPKIESQETDRGERDYVRLFSIAKEVIKGVRAGVFVPNRGCWLCSDCEFDTDCREWTGNED